MKRVKHDLIVARAEVRRLLDAIPAYSPGDRQAHHRGVEDALIALRSLGARVNDRSDPVTIVYAGVRSSATDGVASALRNWLAASGRQLDRQAIAGMSK